MSDSSIMEAVKAFLKPIITEALQEVGTVADTETETSIATAVAESQETPAVDPEAERRAIMSKYYTVEEVKEILRIGTTSVYNLFKRKQLTKLKVLGKTVVLREELDNAVEAQDVCRYKHSR